MTTLLKTEIGRLRIIEFLEGMSLILLYFVAVPLKYMADFPLLVRIIGTIHGALFVAFIIMAYLFSESRNWGWTKLLKVILIASFIPFGIFYTDSKILSKEK